MQRIEERKLDSAGRVKSAESDTYEVMVLYGRPLRRLVEKEGRPLSPDEDRKEQRKMDKEVERRRRESEKERKKRIAEEFKYLDEQRRLRAEIPKAYHFTRLGEDSLDGKPVFVIQSEPRRDYRPPDFPEAKILPRFRGKLWIEKEDYRWVRVEAEAVQTVSYGLFLARVHPGTRISFEQRNVEGPVWLPHQILVRVKARLGLFVNFHREFEISYDCYRKFQADSRIVSTAEVPAP